MDYVKLLKVAYSKESKVRLEIKREIVNQLGIRKGTNFKKGITIAELIDDKISNDDQRFVKYISMTEKISSNLMNKYPFLNLEDFSLEWNANDLIDGCLEQYKNFIKMLSEIEPYKVEKPKNNLKESN